MPINIDQLRKFDSNWGNLVVQQGNSGAQVKAGGLRHALASMFHLPGAEARNKATYKAIRDAIQLDERFFAPEVQAKADELLKGLDKGSRIKASTIRDIIGQLDAMSTPEKQREAVRKAAIGHLATLGVPGSIPASVQEKYKELAADFAAVRPDGGGSMASIQVDQRVTEFNRLMSGIFRGMGDDAEATEVFCKTLNRLETGEGAVSVGNMADRIQTLADAVRDNMRELDEIGNSRGDAIRNSFAATLKTTGALRADVLTTIADKGAALPKCGLEFLDGHSGAGAVHSAISKMADAMEKARAELPSSTTRGIDDDAVGACLVKAAMVRLPESARRNLLAALNSHGGMNLFGYYAQQSEDPKAQRMGLVYSALVSHLRAEFEGADPGAAVQAPDVDGAALPANARCAFSTDDIMTGGLAQQLKDFAIGGSGIQAAPDPAAELRRRMDTIAKGEVFLQMVTGMDRLLDPGENMTKVVNFDKPELDFDKDIVREVPTHPDYITIHMSDGTRVTPQTPAEARDALLRFVTDDPNATYAALDNHREGDIKLKTKVHLLMCCMHQGSAKTAQDSVGLAFDPNVQLSRLMGTKSHLAGERTQKYTLSRDENGAVNISYELRFTSPQLQVEHDGMFSAMDTDADSVCDYSLEIAIPRDNLEKLAGAKWATLRADDARNAEQDIADTTRFETLQEKLPEEFGFTGDVKTSIHIHAGEA